MEAIENKGPIEKQMMNELVNPKKNWKTINGLLGRTLSNIIVHELKVDDKKINSLVK